MTPDKITASKENQYFFHFTVFHFFAKNDLVKEIRGEEQRPTRVKFVEKTYGTHFHLNPTLSKFFCQHH